MLGTWLLANETLFRLTVFISVFVFFALYEWRVPARPLLLAKLQRWRANLSLVLFNSLVLRVLFPLAGTGAALWCQQQRFGLFFQLDALQQWPVVTVLLSVLVLDLIIYFQHRLFHRLPFLWRIHRVHHADLDYDITTGTRFHTLEMVLSMLIKLLAITLLGVPVLAVIVFETVLNASAMFNHSNIRLPAVVDRWLRVWLVTPDMHRVHHSVIPGELNSNYGFFLSCWDRWFASYQAQPVKGHQGMRIGLSADRDPQRVATLKGILTMPFRSGKTEPRS
jgi:sterol desaturase/sphingolipid hydroxylase (fatty acid hydroxylase superfamily)